MLNHPSQQTYTVPPYTDTQDSCTTTLYCIPALSIQMTSEMMNVVVISPQRCSSGRRGINVKPPGTHPALYIPATAHTQWPQSKNPNDTSFIIPSFYVKTLKEAARKCTFFTMIYMEERVGDMSCAQSCLLSYKFENIQHWISGGAFFFFWLDGSQAGPAL